MFVALEPRRLYRQVAEEIRALIDAGGIAVGERLPSERELAERFGVSRPTVREALIVLEVEGRIQIRVGSGVYVTGKPAFPAKVLPHDDSESPFEILQARCLIEGAIAEEAARRITPDGIARLNETLERMEASVEDASQALFWDRAFHTAITDMIGNGALNRFTGIIYDSRMSPYFEKLASHFEGPHTWRLAVEEHKAIRDAIRTGDPAGAREAMRHHLTQSQQRFSESFGEEPTRED
ncbi:FadR/GntR family transcriptional regulator [Neorhizobium alkalisoli]|uniref:GntR family transcriptional regulator n=1 Tax=Neorhizobium alkalisoli TaxID=528178 RepID=A0A561Q838_9HYPH|nr:FadR/GntR family transcriptional regulator [Neorhizobium alkalisoli]TWF46533.1 GntR family transcriptional regulator [Neorhizobium alkalisoli]